MFKNVTGQKIAVQALDQTTGGGKTGDAANILVYVNKDGAGANATSNAVSEVDATKDPGGYIVTLLTAETNADYLRISGKSTTSNIVIVPQNIFTTPANFSSQVIDSSGFLTLSTTQRPGFRKNVACNFAVFMTDSTNHAPATSKTVSVTRSLDGAAFAAGTIGAVSEISSGWYYFAMAAGDMNGDIVLIRATAAACDDKNHEIRTTP